MSETTVQSEIAPEERVLDRIPNFDPKSRQYTVREYLETAQPRRGRSRQPGPTLDQGREGACTGFGLAHVMNASPKMKKPALTNEHARAVYKRAQFLDEWPGENYDGSSVNGAMRAAREAGYVTEWRWVGAGSGRLEDDVVDTLSKIGTIELGTYWYPSMFRPRPSGLIEVDMTQRPAGGHAYCALTYTKRALPGEGKGRKELIVIQNSWGQGYGTKYYNKGGFAFIKLEDVIALLEKQGEGAVPIKA